MGVAFGFLVCYLVCFLLFGFGVGCCLFDLSAGLWGWLVVVWRAMPWGALVYALLLEDVCCFGFFGLVFSY